MQLFRYARTSISKVDRFPEGYGCSESIRYLGGCVTQRKGLAFELDFLDRGVEVMWSEDVIDIFLIDAEWSIWSRCPFPDWNWNWSSKGRDGKRLKVGDTMVGLEEAER